MAKAWDEIERISGFEGIRRVVEQQIVPELETIEAETLDKRGQPKGIESAMSWAFSLFAFLFLIPFFLLPDTFLGVLLRFVLFPLMFIGTLIAALWLNRKKLTAYLLRAHGRHQVRSQAMTKIANHLGLNYVANPGKRPAALDWLAKQSWVPPELRDALQTVGGTGEMLEAVDAMRDSGLLTGNVTVIGSEAQKAQYAEQLSASFHFEDGFHGVRGGIAFDILEWKESQDEADDIFHLMIVLKAPRPQPGVIQMKSRKASWWRSPGDKPLERVRVGPEEFRANYQVRADDQVEAHALFDPAVVARMIDITHEDTLRASALGDTLVFDVAGANRFVIMDPATGAWSEETLRDGLSDLAEALCLVDALADAFRVGRSAVVA